MFKETFLSKNHQAHPLGPISICLADCDDGEMMER